MLTLVEYGAGKIGELLWYRHWALNESSWNEFNMAIVKYRME